MKFPRVILGQGPNTKTKKSDVVCRLDSKPQAPGYLIVTAKAVIRGARKRLVPRPLTAPLPVGPVGMGPVGWGHLSRRWVRFTFDAVQLSIS